MEVCRNARHTSIFVVIRQLRSLEALLVGSCRYLVMGRLVVRVRTLVVRVRTLVVRVRTLAMRVRRRSGDVVNSLLTLASTVVLSMLWL